MGHWDWWHCGSVERSRSIGQPPNVGWPSCLQVFAPLHTFPHLFVHLCCRLRWHEPLLRAKRPRPDLRTMEHLWRRPWGGDSGPQLTAIYRNFTAILPQFTAILPQFTAILPQFTAILPQFTAILPQFYRNFTAILLQFYRKFTAIYRKFTAILPQFYRDFTAIYHNLPQFYRNFTAILPQFTAILLQFYHNFTANFFQAWGTAIPPPPAAPHGAMLGTLDNVFHGSAA